MLLVVLVVVQLVVLLVVLSCAVMLLIAQLARRLSVKSVITEQTQLLASEQ